MANLSNPTPLNVAPVAQASGTPTAVKGAPASAETRPPQVAALGHTPGPPGHATPHALPPATAGVNHTPSTATLGAGTTQKK